LLWRLRQVGFGEVFHGRENVLALTILKYLGGYAREDGKGTGSCAAHTGKHKHI
jgi:stringent starvation protein B